MRGEQYLWIFALVIDLWIPVAVSDFFTVCDAQSLLVSVLVYLSVSFAFSSFWVRVGVRDLYKCRYLWWSNPLWISTATKPFVGLCMHAVVKELLVPAVVCGMSLFGTVTNSV